MDSSFWHQFLILFGGNAMILAALGFLFKSLLAQMLAKDIEKFKIELKADADIAMERHKHTLQIAALEHQVRFSKLHEKRALVVADLYERFVTAYWAAHTYHQWFIPGGGRTRISSVHNGQWALVKTGETKSKKKRSLAPETEVSLRPNQCELARLEKFCRTRAGAVLCGVGVSSRMQAQFFSTYASWHRRRR